MRTITINELPEDLHRLTVIKSSERTRHQRMAVALERTLNRCSEIHAEYELQTVRLRENCERQAFQTGFELFFSQLVTLLDEYQRQQQKRQEFFRQQIATVLNQSLHDPMIVERIIHHLQEQCGHQKALRIVIPRAVKLPNGADISNYLHTDDNHITMQNDMDAVRFPSETLCRTWLQQADEKTAGFNETINNLTPDMLRNLAGKLIAMSHRMPLETVNSDKDENNE
ncbi:type III secretion protein [Serratia odorifera]|uniref:type III secretion protein n=1 Tax=Serratia odorifera TaxID=618 RepID=UPI0018E6DC60|nr:type III secretion protein [Serratia odorifera]MBJ2066138.1 type III secretion protein [Serratia odorifera]